MWLQSLHQPNTMWCHLGSNMCTRTCNAEKARDHKSLAAWRWHSKVSYTPDKLLKLSEPLFYYQKNGGDDIITEQYTPTLLPASLVITITRFIRKFCPLSTSCQGVRSMPHRTLRTGISLEKMDKSPKLNIHQGPRVLIANIYTAPTSLSVWIY